MVLHSHFYFLSTKAIIHSRRSILFCLLLLLGVGNLPQLSAQNFGVEFGTYIGGSNGATNHLCTFVDAANCTYVTGTTQASTFMTTDGSVAMAGDAYVQKYAPDGTLVYSRVYGGSGNETISEAQKDGGSIFITMSTDSPDMPMASNTYSGGGDLFVYELDCATGDIITGGYFGGPGAETTGTTTIMADRICVASATGASAAGNVAFSCLDRTTGMTCSATTGATNSPFFATSVENVINDGTCTYVLMSGQIFGFGDPVFPVTDGSTCATAPFESIYFLVKFDANCSPVYGTCFAAFSGTIDLNVFGGVVYVTAFTGEAANWPISPAASGRGVVNLQLDAATGSVLSSGVTFPDNGFSTTNVYFENGCYFYELSGTTAGSLGPSTDGSLPSNGDAAGDVSAIAKVDANGMLSYLTYLPGGASSTFNTAFSNGCVFVNVSNTAGNIQDLPHVNVDEGVENVNGTYIAKIASDGTYQTGGIFNGIPISPPLAFNAAFLEKATTDLSDAVAITRALDAFFDQGTLSTDNKDFDVDFIAPDKVIVSLDSEVTNADNTCLPTTDASADNPNGTAGLFCLDLCPDLPAGADLSPDNQMVCQNGVIGQITGESGVLAGTDLPLTYIKGVPTPQPDIAPDYYQWQISSDGGASWTDIGGAVTQDYTPQPIVADRCYRRLSVRACCPTVESEVVCVSVTADAAPEIEAGGPYNTCPGTAVSINSTPSGGTPPYSFMWSNGETTEDFMVTVTETSIFTVTITDMNGCEQIDQAIVNAYEADATPGDDAVVTSCAGDPILIGGDPIPGVIGVTYSWMPTAGLSCTDCPNPLAAPAMSTDYTLTLTIPVTGGGTCETMSTVTVDVINAPATDFAGPDITICKGDNAPMGLPAEAGFNYTWAPGSYIAPNDQAQTTFDAGINVPDPNPFTYYLTAEQNGCVFVDQVDAYVICADAGDDRCVVGGTLGTPDPTPNFDETYSWTCLTGNCDFLGATDQPQILVGNATAGDATYQLSVTYNGVTCIDDITVFEVCGTCTADIIVSAPNTCPDFSTNGGDVTLEGAASITGIDPGDLVYTWSVESGTTSPTGLSSTTGQTVTLTDDLTRTIKMTAVSASDPSLMCMATIDINPPLASVPTFDSTDGAGCENDMVAIGAPVVAGYSYEWSPATGLDNSASSMPTATVGATSTTYSVTVTDDGTGCTTEEEVTLTSNNVQADAGPDILVCDNSVVMLGGEVDYPGATVSWDPAGADWQNGTGPTDAQPEVLVATTTTFTLTVTSDLGDCISTDVVTVTVGTAPTAPTLAPIDYCPGDGAFAIGAGVPAGFTYLWSPAALLDDPTAQMPMVTTPPNSSVTFTVAILSPEGCETTATQTINPTVSAASAGSDATVCLGESTTIGSALNATGAGISYTWSPLTDIAPNGDGTATFTPSATGTFTFMLEQDDNGCISTDAVTVTVEEYNLPAFPSSVVVCEGASAQIGTTPEGGVQYFWSPTTGLDDPNSSNPTVSNVTTATTYTLTAVASNGCVAQAEVTVGVNPVPGPSVAIPSRIMCLGDDPLQFMPIETPAGTYQYQWSPDDGTLDDIYSSSPMVSGFGLGTQSYEVTITDQATGCSTTATTSLTVQMCTAFVAKCPVYVPVCVEEFDAAPDTDLLEDGNGSCADPAGGNPNDGGTYIITDVANSPLMGWNNPSEILDAPLLPGQIAPSGSFMIINAFNAMGTGQSCQSVTDDANGNGTGGELVCLTKAGLPAGEYSLSAFFAELTNTTPGTSSYSFVVTDVNTGTQISNIATNNIAQGNTNWQYNEGQFTLTSATDVRICLQQNTNIDVGADIAIDRFQLSRIDDFCVDATASTTNCGAGTSEVTFDVMGGTAPYTITSASIPNAPIMIGTMGDTNPVSEVVVTGISIPGTYTYTITDANGCEFSGIFTMDSECVLEKCTVYTPLCTETFDVAPDTDLLEDGTTGCNDPAGGNPNDGGTYIITDVANSPLSGWSNPSEVLDMALAPGQIAPSGSFMIINAFANQGQFCQNITDDANANGTGGELVCLDKTAVPAGTYALSAFFAELTNTDPATSTYSFVVTDANTGLTITNIPTDNITMGNTNWQYNEGLFTLNATTDLRICLQQNTNLDAGADIAIDNFQLSSIEQYCVEATTSTVDCEDFSGEVTFDIMGGTGPYEITGGGLPNAPITIVDMDGDGTVSEEVETGIDLAGTYFYTVTDANGCTYDGSLMIDADCAVPVELSYFKGETIDCQVKLSWKTETELDNSHFEVEHSLDGKTFASIAKIEGAGTSIIPQEYSYTDVNAERGNNYYRLKQVDLDGRYEYFDIILIQNDCEVNNKGLKISPVPLSPSQLLQVEFYTDNLLEDVVIKVTSVNGIIVKQIVAKPTQDGWNRISIDLSELPGGVYHLWNNKGEVKKLILTE